MSKNHDRKIPKKDYKFVKSLFGKSDIIPEEWRSIKLLNLAKLSAGGTPSRFEPKYWILGTINWISSGEVKNNVIDDSREKITRLGLEKSSARLFPKHSVLIAITGQGLTRGRVAILNICATTNQSVIGIICEKNLNYKFLFYYLQNEYTRLRNISQGGNQAGLNLEIMRSYKILIPKTSEQQKIASILSNVDALIESTQKVIDDTKSLKTGLMQKLLIRGIGHKKFKKIKWLFGTEIEIPEDWKQTFIGQLSIKIHYGYTANASKKKIGPKYLRITDIQNDSVIWNDVPYCKISKQKSLNYILKPNDLVFARSGTVGKSFLIKNPPQAIFASYLIRIILSKKVSPNFVSHFFNSYLYWKQIQKGKVGMVQLNFNATKISKIKIPIPPLLEQQKIASILSDVDALENILMLLLILCMKFTIFPTYFIIIIHHKFHNMKMHV